MQIGRLIHNQPFMLEPTPKERRIEGEVESLRESNRQLERVDKLKDKIRRLVETPLFFNAELLKHHLIEEDGRLLHLVHKQPGVYALLRAAQVNQRRCLRAQLEAKRIGLTSLLPGIYAEVQLQKLQVDNEEISHVSLLQTDLIAEVIVKELFNAKAINAREYVAKQEWNIYEDFT